ncbi:MAG: saccharopine dehydrogenase NADP-binding domain-containing protein [Legionellales bacterium]|nr:saccharopine dehydrogenase NADP-binding domain-containing protein [Legionellales bacterium]
MHNVMIVGAGKIGTTLSVMLSNSENYKIYLLDTNFDLFNSTVNSFTKNINPIKLDISKVNEVTNYITKNNIVALISALPFYLTSKVAQLAKDTNVHYFDLTEDVATTKQIFELSKDAKSAFVPQCGLAPGIVGIIANHLIKKFDKVVDVKLRVGALPQFTTNKLKYSLTWSTDGLINEYLNPSIIIKNGNLASSAPLEDYETIIIDGVEYEAFNTSGGIGSLAKINLGKINNMNYKSIRYKSHRDEFLKLIHKYSAQENPKRLKQHLEETIPTTFQDVVIIYVSVVGYIDKILQEKVFTKKIYPAKIGNINARAIQIATAAGICGSIHSVLQDPNLHGFIYQETLSFPSLLYSEFGKFFNFD